MNNLSIDSKIIVIDDLYYKLDLKKEDFIELDIGSGKGSFTTALAKKYPNRVIIAIDILKGRLRKLVKRNMIEDAHNVMVFKVESWYFLTRVLPDNSINRVHILCPDPWSKNRHKRNRLISSEFIGRIYKKLKPNGILHFSSDNYGYCQHVLNVIMRSKLYIYDNNLISDILEIKSDFEKRWNEMGLKVKHIAFKAI